MNESNIRLIGLLARKGFGRSHTPDRNDVRLLGLPPESVGSDMGTIVENLTDRDYAAVLSRAIELPDPEPEEKDRPTDRPWANLSRADVTEALMAVAGDIVASRFWTEGESGSWLVANAVTDELGDVGLTLSDDERSDIHAAAVAMCEKALTIPNDHAKPPAAKPISTGTIAPPLQS